MTGLPPASITLFDLFKDFTQQVLREPPLNSAPGYQIFDYGALHGAFVVWFHALSDEDPHVVGYLPASAGGQGEEIAEFQLAVRTCRDLHEVTARDRRCERLRTLYAVFNGEGEGILEFRVPTTSPVAETLKAQERSQVAAARALEQTTVSWRALALDVLSGFPTPQLGAEPPAERFEVWAYRPDPATSVIVRHFDEARAWSAAACRPGITHEDLTFETALDALFKARLAPPKSLDGKSAAFESFFARQTTAEAMTLLGTGLGIYFEQGGIVYEPGLFGEATGATLERVRTLRAMERGGPLGEPPSHFEIMAQTLLDAASPDEELLWTEMREREGLERIELLRHRVHPGLVMLHIDPATELTVSAYIPASKELAREPLETAIAAFVHARRLLTDKPLSMPDISPFVRLKTGIDDALREALGSLDAGEGEVHSYPQQVLADQVARLARDNPLILDRTPDLRLH